VVKIKIHFSYPSFSLLDHLNHKSSFINIDIDIYIDTNININMNINVNINININININSINKHPI